MASNEKQSKKTVKDDLDEFTERADKIFREISTTVALLNSGKTEISQARLLKTKNVIIENNMVEFYESTLKGHFSITSEKLSEMAENSKKAVSSLDKSFEESKSTMDVIEKQRFYLRKAKVIALTGDKKKALSIYQKAAQVNTSNSSVVAVYFELLKFSVFVADFEIFREYFDLAKKLELKGIDWEKRNTLKIFEAVLLMKDGKIELSAEALIESISTFASDFLFDFSTLCFYAVLLAVATFDRAKLAKKVVESPEITSVIGDTKGLKPYLDSVYKCEYSKFFSSIEEMKEKIETDRFLGAHMDRLFRAAKRTVYSQFIHSYLSVKLDSVSAAFKVPVSSIENDFFSYISRKEIHAKIDKINGLIHRSQRNTELDCFAAAVSKGDQVMQSIARFTNLLEI